MMSYEAAVRPTFYFIGVTTGSSSIMKVFPRWAQHLGLGEVDMRGVDFVPHDRPERYRELVALEMAGCYDNGSPRERVVCDLIASMTDHSALTLYQKIFFPSPMV